MNYHDHGTSMVLRLGVWSDAHSSRKVVGRSWEIEKELAERRSPPRLDRPRVIKRAVTHCIARIRLLG